MADRGRKMQMFARFRVPEYWIAGPESRAIEIHRLRGDAYVLVETVSGEAPVTSPLLPGLRFPSGDVFPPAATR